MIKHHVLWAGKTRLGFLSSSGIKFMFANEAKLLNEVLPANPLLNQLLQLLSERKREINHSATIEKWTHPSLGGFYSYNSWVSVSSLSHSRCCIHNAILQWPLASVPGAGTHRFKGPIQNNYLLCLARGGSVVVLPIRNIHRKHATKSMQHRSVKSLLIHHLPFTESFPTVIFFLQHTYFL